MFSLQGRHGRLLAGKTAKPAATCITGMLLFGKKPGKTKEGCNRGRGLSAAIYLGSLEKNRWSFYDCTLVCTEADFLSAMSLRRTSKDLNFLSFLFLLY